MAEGEGFEPSVPLLARWFSRPFPSTTRTPFHICYGTICQKQIRALCNRGDYTRSCPKFLGLSEHYCINPFSTGSFQYSCGCFQSAACGQNVIDQHNVLTVDVSRVYRSKRAIQLLQALASVRLPPGALGQREPVASHVVA